MTHACPRCGTQTEGTYSEGGLLWAICFSCMRNDVDIQRQRQEHLPQRLGLVWPTQQTEEIEEVEE